VTPRPLFPALRRALLVLVPVVWLGFAHGLWQRRWYLWYVWVYWRARPSASRHMWKVLFWATTAFLVAITVGGLWPTPHLPAPAPPFSPLRVSDGGTGPPLTLVTTDRAWMPGTGAGTGSVTTNEILTTEAHALPPQVIRYTREDRIVLANAGTQPVRCARKDVPLSPIQGVLLQPGDPLTLPRYQVGAPWRCLPAD
jgi:hypothetical protein